LGCTHYPFVRPLLEKIVGPTVNIIDPAPAVARQTIRLLQENDLLVEGTAVPPVTALTTGPATQLEQFANQVLSFPIVVETAVWHNGQLHAAQ
jgi:glutamate racemase